MCNIPSSVRDLIVHTSVEMFKSAVLLSFLVGACYGNATPQGTYCAHIPNVILNCLHNPKIPTSIACKKSDNECNKMTCLFRESGWFDGEKVNKLKVTQYFNNFAKDYPDWLPAVQHLKTACLSTDLPAQGIHINCPAYDIMHCALTSFIRNAKVSQWSTTKECEYSRQFAAACPVCPSECYATEVPIGSCNACLSLPRSP